MTESRSNRDPSLQRAARWIREASRVAALTGAGISVESGIPDFRSPDGLWSVFDPMEYATLSCFRLFPEKAWRLYRALGRNLLGKRPNPAHEALARLERAGRLAGVVTQNVDGLHQAAGSLAVLEIHGNGAGLECPQCGFGEPMTEDHLEPGAVPRCAVCHGPVKPSVVLFEEPVRHMEEIRALLDATDLLLSVGTSAQVAPSGLFPAEVAARGGRFIEFNVEPTELSSVYGSDQHLLVRGRAGATLPRVVDLALASPGHA